MNIVFFFVTFMLGILFGGAAIQVIIDKVIEKPSFGNIFCAVILAACSFFMMLESFC